MTSSWQENPAVLPSWEVRSRREPRPSRRAGRSLRESQPGASCEAEDPRNAGPRWCRIRGGGSGDQEGSRLLPFFLFPPPLPSRQKPGQIPYQGRPEPPLKMAAETGDRAGGAREEGRSWSQPRT
ncbi:hypothetical protein NDU88_006194 [Pleurodeles waltl]|uniref:Uncharacterized protein n=1 Tax=Pleurodeles waltl TaxID=8319 RepID=A0AAV7VP09_PLEWA|nr:hypothetical protein NDU88_006194 [Pleurodeles waltl]